MSVVRLPPVDDAYSVVKASGGAAKHTRAWSVGTPGAVAGCRRLKWWQLRSTCKHRTAGKMRLCLSARSARGAARTGLRYPPATSPDIPHRSLPDARSRTTATCRPSGPTRPLSASPGDLPEPGASTLRAPCRPGRRTRSHRRSHSDRATRPESRLFGTGSLTDGPARGECVTARQRRQARAGRRAHPWTTAAAQRRRVPRRIPRPSRSGTKEPRGRIPPPRGVKSQVKPWHPHPSGHLGQDLTCTAPSVLPVRRNTNHGRQRP
ncbi:hypothetical protein SUDANB126_04117 [Streptomyces sp. enrichment culture]